MPPYLACSTRFYFLGLLKEKTKTIKEPHGLRWLPAEIPALERLRLQIQGQLGLGSEFQVSLVFRESHSLKKERKGTSNQAALLMFLMQQRFG